MIQGAIRQAKAEHTPPHTAAKKRKGNKAITVITLKTIKSAVHKRLMCGIFANFTSNMKNEKQKRYKHYMKTK